MSSRSMAPVIALMVLIHGASFGVDRQTSVSEQEFCKLDQNNDREISLEEFANCEFYKLERMRALPLMEMKDLKKDSNGSVSEKDLKVYLFNKADRNRSGKIERKEWEEFYNSLIEPGADNVR